MAVCGSCVPRSRASAAQRCCTSQSVCRYRTERRWRPMPSREKQCSAPRPPLLHGCRRAPASRTRLHRAPRPPARRRSSQCQVRLLGCLRPTRPCPRSSNTTSLWALTSLRHRASTACGAPGGQRPSGAPATPTVRTTRGYRSNYRLRRTSKASSSTTAATAAMTNWESLRSGWAPHRVIRPPCALAGRCRAANRAAHRWPTRQRRGGSRLWPVGWWVPS